MVPTYFKIDRYLMKQEWAESLQHHTMVKYLKKFSHSNYSYKYYTILVAIRRTRNKQKIFFLSSGKVYVIVSRNEQIFRFGSQVSAAACIFLSKNKKIFRNNHVYRYLYREYLFNQSQVVTWAQDFANKT